MKKIIICLFTLLILAGCNQAAVKEEGKIDVSYSDGVLNYSSKASDTIIEDGQKIITTSDVTLETYNLEETIKAYNEEVLKLGGYVQKSTEQESNHYNYSRYAYLIVRIPADKFNNFGEYVKGSGNVLNFSIENDDITESYYETTSRLESLKLQEARIKEMYKQAGTISELIEVEKRLSEVQSEIAAKETILQKYDLLTSYSTMTVSIYEVKEYTEEKETFIDRFKEACKESWENFTQFLEDLLLGIVSGFWFILMLGVIGVAIYFVVRRNYRKSKIKKEDTKA